jgi:Spy/CpxP family protein refolding chaperone
MKQNSKKLMLGGLVISAVFCASLLSFADDMKSGTNDWQGGRLAKMKETLGLSDTQVASIKAIQDGSWKNIEPLRKQTRIDLENLKAQVKTGAPDKDLTASIDALQADRKKMMEARKASMEQVKAILTPLQQAKAMIAMSERMGKRQHYKAEEDSDK